MTREERKKWLREQKRIRECSILPLHVAKALRAYAIEQENKKKEKENKS